MQDQNQFDLNMSAVTGILLFLFAIASGGIPIGALVGIIYVPTDVESVFPFLAVAGSTLVFGFALTALFCGSILVVPQPRARTLGLILVTYSIKRSLSIDRAKSG